MEMKYFDTKYDNDMVPIKTNDKELQVSFWKENSLVAFIGFLFFFYLYEMKLEPFDSYKQENNN